MSSNKKSAGLLLLGLFLFVAVASWFYFSGQSDQSSDEVNQAEGESVEVPRDHGHDHSHPYSGYKAETGQIHEMAINPVLGRRSVGDPNAPIKIQEFFSLTCNHCANFHNGPYKELKSKYIDTGKVYFIFEEFPLNGPALYGSMIARCMPEERYENFIDLLLRNQDVWAFGGDFKGALKQNAALAGMSEEDFEACFNNKEMQKAIAENIKEASEAWKLTSTPSFVVNDGAKIIRGSKKIEDFDSVIAELLGETAPAAASDDSADMETQRRIWRQMEAGTYDPKTFKIPDSNSSETNSQ